RGLRRKRLRARGALARYVARGHHAFDDWEQRLARGALEQEHMSRLRADGDCRDARTSFALEWEQQRRRSNVIVPEVVMHGLEMPHDLTARSVQRDNRIRVLVAALAQAAEVVRARAAGRYEHDPTLL